MPVLVKRTNGATCCLPLERWPEADITAWHAAIRAGSLFDEPGLGAHWAPSTKNGVRRAYGRWLLWLGKTVDRYAETPLEDRVTRSAIESYVAVLRTTTADTSVSAYISFLHMALQAMAPQGDWGWIKNIYMKIKRRAPIVRQKRHRIQSSKLLCQLGVDLMIESEQRDGLSPLEQAQQYRDGLIIALLAIRPLRTKNFVALALGETLVERSGRLWISFGPEATKSRAPIEHPFPEPLLPYLDHYIDYVRPYLMLRHRSSARRAGLQLPGNFLWISSNGGPLSKNAFFDLVSKRTAKRFGTAINPHLFRNCLATTVATETPDAVSSTSQLLGHASLLTSERHYNHADGLKASRLLQTHVLALRRLQTARRTRSRSHTA